MKTTPLNSFMMLFCATLCIGLLLLPGTTFANEIGGTIHITPHHRYVHKEYVGEGNDGLIACPEERPLTCMQELKPVCGQKRDGDNNDANYTNSCLACKDPDVIGYTDGHCSDQP